MKSGSAVAIHERGQEKRRHEAKKTEDIQNPKVKYDESDGAGVGSGGQWKRKGKEECKLRLYVRTVRRSSVFQRHPCSRQN